MVFGKCVQCVKRSRCESGLSVEEASARSKWKKLSVDRANKKKKKLNMTQLMSQSSSASQVIGIYMLRIINIFFSIRQFIVFS